MDQFYKSLAFKIGLVIIFTEMIVLFAAGLVYIDRFSQAIDTQLETDARLPGELMNSGLLSLASLGDETTMALLVNEELLEGLAVDADGDVFASLNPEHTGKNIQDIPGIDPKLFDFVQPEQKIIESQGFLVSVSPIMSPDEEIPRLYTYIKISTDRANAEKNNVIQIFVLGSIATVMLTSAIIFISLRYAVLDRLARLVAVLEQVEIGNLKARSVSNNLNDEIGVLQRQVNSMVERLEEQVNTLEERVNERTQELELTNSELQAFSYTVSHDLRAPIRAILGFGDIFYDEYGKNLAEPAQEYLYKISDSAKRMDQLILDLLDFSKISYTKISNQEVDLSILAEDIRKFLKQLEPDREVEFHISEGLKAFGDARLLRVLLDNLLGNAWKYSKNKNGAAIKFDSDFVDGKTVFFIEDNGVGFDMAYVDKVFHVFQRLHTDAQFEGTGIGLATAQKIVTKHKGEIWVEAEEGLGAIFYFTLNLKE